MSNINWNSLYCLTVADDAFNGFWDSFNTVFELHSPLITKNFNKNIHKLQPFMTKGLLASRRTKLKLLLILKENPSVETLNAFKQFRNLYNQLIRASKKMYYSVKIDSSKHDLKSLWKTLNEAIITENSLKIVLSIVFL